jgi:crotonobetainyl-CoA:carnitine CoA-transferase CaiB-like acyl-CoA transferase
MNQPSPRSPGQPDAEQPGSERPDSERFGSERPGSERPGSERPGSERPGSERPGSAQPGSGQATSGQSGSGAQRTGPLAGLLVADFSRVLAGPYCTMLLADLGADVIKVESPDGDDTRRWMPPVTADGVSTYFLAINRNKRSVALDLRDPRDLAAARELARRADIFVQNFKPGGLAKYGLDYASVLAANPAIIYASISGFGTAGGKDLPGYDLIVQAMSGLMSLTGDPGGPPYRAGISLFDVMAGLHTTIAILAALHHRSVTGAGQHVEASLLASALSGMVNQTSAYAAGGVVPFRMGNSHPSLFPYDPLPTADGDLIVAAGNDTQFRRLCEVIGAPGLAGDPRFASNAGRTANRDELRPLLAAGLASRTAAEWFGVLTTAGVPCGPINTVDAGVNFARDIGLEPVVTAGEGAGAMSTVRHPIGYSVTPPDYPLPPPALDEHGEQIRAWLAGPSAPVPPAATGQTGTAVTPTGQTRTAATTTDQTGTAR